MKGLPSVEALESAHAFPCPYTFKVFGPGESTLHEDARRTAQRLVTQPDEVQLSVRASSQGRHVCVSLTVLAESASQVQDIYRALVRLETVKFLL